MKSNADPFQDKLVHCAGCGKKMLWGMNPLTERPVPLDPSAVVYLVQFKQGQVVAERVTTDQHPRVMVSHFHTCSAATQFSGKGRAKKKEGQP